MYSIHGQYWMAPLGGVVSAGLSLWLLRDVLRRPEGSDRMKSVAGQVMEGALAYLRRQYRSSAIAFAAVALALGILAVGGFLNPFVPFAFLTGGFFSALSGFIGLKAACGASPRAAWALRESLDGGFMVVFRAGSVLGLAVAGFGLLDISLWYYVINVIYDHDIFGFGLDLAGKAGLPGEEFSALWLVDPAFLKVKGLEVASVMLTFGLGASLHALFARMGGGIFSKAADPGADLIGNGDRGILHFDARNPAAIAGKVGESVGAVSGTGADLYASFCCSILAASTLGAAMVAGREGEITRSGKEIGLLLAPLLIAALGSVLSGLGMLSMRVGTVASRKNLLPALGRSLLVSAALVAAAVWALCRWFDLGWGAGMSMLTGLSVGLLLGQVSRCFAPAGARSAFRVARSAKLGPAALVLNGLATGMLSTGFPTLAIAAGTLMAFAFSGGFQDLAMGFYGMSLSTVGMLSTLAANLSVGVHGPIAVLAAGNAEMAGLDPEVRDRADTLGTLGSTTSSMGSGYATGAACLSAVALLAAYAELTGVRINLPMGAPELVIGLFLGVILMFLFSALTLEAVGRAGERMVEDVRRQAMVTAGLLEEEAMPDYDACISMSAAGVHRDLRLPAFLALVVPVLAGMVLGAAGVFGLLLGSLVTGFAMAVMLNGAGRAWDDARRFVEGGNFGGKGSDAHRACIIGVTMGGPLKDAVAPSLAILVGLMTMVSIVSAGLVPGLGSTRNGILGQPDISRETQESGEGRCRPLLSIRYSRELREIFK